MHPKGEGYDRPSPIQFSPRLARMQQKSLLRNDLSKVIQWSDQLKHPRGEWYDPLSQIQISHRLVRKRQCVLLHWCRWGGGEGLWARRFWHGKDQGHY